jgi:hypothetical protein
MEAAFARTTLDLDLMLDRRIMQASLSGRSTPSSDTRNAILQVQGAMMARRKLCGDLASLYDAFASLASYDAAAEVEGAWGELAATGKEFAQAVRADTSVWEPAGALTSRFADALAIHAQNARLRQTSAAIREVLLRVRELLAKEDSVYGSVRGQIERIAATASVELYRSGIGKPHPLLRDLLDPRDFSYNEELANRALAGPRADTIRQGIQDVLQHRVERRIELEKVVLAGFGSLLAQLEQEHLALEAKQPLNLRAVTERLAAVRETIELVADLRRHSAPDDATKP